MRAKGGEKDRVNMVLAIEAPKAEICVYCHERGMLF